MRAKGGWADQNLTAECAAPVELAASPGPILVDGAGTRCRVQRDACAVALLVHEAHAVVLHHELLRHKVHISLQLHQQVAATGAADAGGDIGMLIGGNGLTGAGVSAGGDL